MMKEHHATLKFHGISSLLPSLEQGSTPAMPLRVLSVRIRDDQHAAREGRLFHLVNFAPWRCLVRTIKILDLSQYYSPCYISFTLTKCTRICLQNKLRYSCSEVFHLSRHYLSIFLQGPLCQFSHGRGSSEIYRKTDERYGPISEVMPNTHESVTAASL